MHSKLKKGESNVFQVWNHKCDNENDADRLSVQVSELVGGEISVSVHFLTR